MAIKYVSALGSNSNSGNSPGAAYATIAYADAFVGSGDTIELLDEGTIIETSKIILPLAVNINGQGIDAPIVRATHNDIAIDMISSGSVKNGNQVLSNFTLDGNNRQAAVGIESRYRSNVTFQNMKVQNFDRGGFAIKLTDATKNNPPAAYQIGVVVQDVTLINCAKDISGSSSGCLQIGGLDGALIENITINENQGYGIKFDNWGWYKNTIIRNCNITVPTQDPLWTQDAGIEMWNIRGGCEIYNCNINTWISLVHGNKGSSTWAIRIYNNVISAPGNVSPKQSMECALSDMEIFDNVFENFGQQGGLSIWKGGETITNHVVYRNKFKSVYGNSVGILMKALATNDTNIINNTKIYNNVFELQKWGILMTASNNSPTIINDPEVRNNIFMGSPGAMIRYEGKSGGPVTVNNPVYTNNCVFQAATIISNGPTSTVNNQTLNNTITSNPQINAFPSYTLKDSSPLIDAGIDVGLPYNGSSPDIGAVEFGEGGGVESVTSFVLINANTDAPIAAFAPLDDNAVINRNTIPNDALNIQANVNPSPVGSVHFELVSIDGSDDLDEIRNTAPYALFDQSGGDFDPHEFITSDYTLTATPYTEADAGGDAGIPLTISFSFSGEPTPPWRPLEFLNAFDQVQVSETLPVPPNFRNVINSDTEALLMWQQVVGVDTYELQMADNLGFTLNVTQINDDDTLGYVHTGRTASTTKYYRVRAKKSNGELSPWSAVATSLTASSHLSETIDTLEYIDAENDTAVSTLTSGAVTTLDTSVIGTTQLNFEATPSGSVSVRFHHPDGGVRQENFSPYTAYGDSAGDYFSKIFSNGKYSLACHAYNTSTGVVGKIEVYTFIVTESGSVPWTPDQISWLARWEPWDSGQYTLNGSDYSELSEQISSYDLTQATAANQPTQGTYDTRTYMTCNNTNDDVLARTDACGLTGNPDLTFVVVGYDLNGRFFGIGDCTQGGGAANAVIYLSNENDGTFDRLSIRYNSGRVRSDATSSTTEPDILIFTNGAASLSSNIEKNGIAGTINDNKGTLALVDTDTKLGDPGQNPDAQGKIFFIGIYSGIMSDSDKRKFEGWAAREFPTGDVLAKLDAGHPYKTVAPTV